MKHRRIRGSVMGGVAAALALLAMSAAASVVDAQGARAIRRIAPGDTLLRDSLMRVELSIGPNELARMVAELAASRETEERIALALRDARPGSAEASRRDLEQQLLRIVRRNSGLVSAIRLQCARGDEMQPEGYMGLNFVGIEVRKIDDGPAMYYFGDNPRIVSVDPGSPAAKAGIEAADEVIAINGNDARRPLALGTLLKPGARISVRLLRDGKQRDAQVTIVKRPDEPSTPCAQVRELVGAHGYPQTVFMRERSPELPREAGTGSTTTLLSGEGGMIARTGPNGFAFMSPYPTMGPGLLGGASFITLDAEWRETLGVDRGLLVTVVAAGSPAQTAGLRKGDVIVGAGDEEVGSMAAFWRVVSSSGPDGVTLKLVRGGKPVTAVFKPRR